MVPPVARITTLGFLAWAAAKLQLTIVSTRIRKNCVLNRAFIGGSLLNRLKLNVLAWTLKNFRQTLSAKEKVISCRLSSSISLEAFGAKLLAHTLDQFICRRLNIVKLIFEPQFLPFESPHLMKGQHIYSLNCAE